MEIWGKTGQAVQVGLDLRGQIGLQTVESSVLGLGTDDEAVVPEVGQVFGGFDLGEAEDGLEFADGQGSGVEQVNDAEPGFVSQTTIERGQLHGGSIPV